MATIRRASTPKRQAQTYQLRIDLKGVNPKVWRRIFVPATIKLNKLHDILQTTMGWMDCHMHSFDINGVEYGTPDLDDDNLLQFEREDRISLKTALAGQTRFLYEYDFGDGWEHVIKVEKVFPPGIPIAVPTCVAGENACPPEDVGGPYGYAEFLATIGDPNHEEHQAMREWVGADFDPTAFEPASVSARIEPKPKRASMRP
jgi:pRiA4b ORF-3-like protein